METFVKSLYDRLPGDRKTDVLMLADQAVNEFLNSGALSMMSLELQEEAHDPDPEVRLTAKTGMAKALGNQLITSSRPGKNRNGLMHVINLDYDPELVHCVALCIQGGLEGLWLSGVWEKNPSRIMDYYVLIQQDDPDDPDITPLRKELELLGTLYPEFHIIPLRLGQGQKDLEGKEYLLASNPREPTPPRPKPSEEENRMKMLRKFSRILKKMQSRGF